MVFNELPPLHHRFEFNGVGSCFDFDPVRRAFLTGIGENKFQVWDLIGTDPLGDPFSSMQPTKWLSYNEFGTHFLMIMGTQRSDSAQLYMPEDASLNPRWRPLHRIWLPGMPIIRHVRMAAEAGSVAFGSGAPGRHQN